MTSPPAGPAGAGGRPRAARALRPGPARAFLRAAIAAFGTARDTLTVLAWLASMIIRPPVSQQAGAPGGGKAATLPSALCCRRATGIVW